jgi:hypothetical protein
MATSSETVIATSIPDEYTRLHITPLNPNLLRAILPPSVLPNARNISYHTIATFPEKGYGYIELPIMDAEKVKKKLSGTILKGSKIRIEKARPEKKLEIEQEEEVEVSKKQKKDSKKRKREHDTISGAEIGERSVKRGWTTPFATKSKDKDVDKKINKSKYTTGPECLFKTVVPPNVAATSKAIEKPEKKKRGKPGKETVVHEFAKTTKYPTFLKSASSGKKAVTAEFVEGKGWVDEEGNVVDEVVKTSKKAASIDKPKRKKKEPTPEPVVEEESGSSEDSSSDENSSSDDEPEIQSAAPVLLTSILKTAPAPAQASIPEPTLDKEDSSESEPSSDSYSDSTDSSSEDEPETGSAAPVVITSILKADPTSIPEPATEDADVSMSKPNSADSESSDSSSSEDQSEKNTSVSATESVIDSRPVSRPQSSSGPPINLSIKIPPSPLTTEIHPLEALYKRPKPGSEAAPKPATESFSFFGADDPQNESEAEEATDQVPLTPYTQRDFEWRGMRSAAPTPDTAHASKRFLWPSSRDDDDDDKDDDVASSPIRGKTDSKGPVKTKFTDQVPAGNGKKDEETDFQKWFYEHRGDTNRAWKKRRRVAGKEKRHRENKKRSDRVI